MVQIKQSQAHLRPSSQLPSVRLQAGMHVGLAQQQPGQVNSRTALSGRQSGQDKQPPVREPGVCAARCSSYEQPRLQCMASVQVF